MGGRSSHTVFTLSFQDQMLVLKKKSGRDPLFSELVLAVHQLLLEYEEEFGVPVLAHQRQHPYRFVRRIGQTGCTTVFLEEDTSDGFPNRRRVFHISMRGKTPDFQAFYPDFLDHLVGEGGLDVEPAGETWAYKPKKGLEIAGTTMKVVRPRLVEYEEGWTSPYSSPATAKTVPLEVCREAPSEE